MFLAARNLHLAIRSSCDAKCLRLKSCLNRFLELWQVCRDFWPMNREVDLRRELSRYSDSQSGICSVEGRHILCSMISIPSHLIPNSVSSVSM